MLVMPRVQGRRRGNNDEQADHVRVAHPDIGVETHPRNLHRSLLRGIDERVRGGIDALVLGLLR